MKPLIDAIKSSFRSTESKGGLRRRPARKRLQGHVGPQVLEERRVLSLSMPGLTHPIPEDVRLLENLGLLESAVEFGGQFFFLVEAGHDEELWVTDGSSTTHLATGSLFHELTPGGDVLFYMESGSLYKTDGTLEGTEIVSTLNDSFPIFWFSPPWRGFDPLLTNANGTVFFRRMTDELWKSDGTAEGTVEVAVIESRPLDAVIEHLTAVGDRVVFTASDGSHGTQLWVSDGTEAGTRMVFDPPPQSTFDVTSIVEFNDKAVFSTGDTVWITDGTTEGTYRLHEQLRGGPSPNSAAVLNGELYFAADDGIHGVELWKTDGSVEGTRLVEGITVGSNGASPDQFTVVGGNLYFVADDGQHGRELRITDGTLDGTMLLRELVPGGHGPMSIELRAGIDELYFVLRDVPLTFNLATSPHVIQFWTSDGTETGTRLVRNIEAENRGTYVGLLGIVEDRLLYAIGEMSSYFDLWSTPLPDGMRLPPFDVASAADGIGLFSPDDAAYFLKHRFGAGPADDLIGFGPPGAGWIPLMGDWNGDGIRTPGAYNPVSSTFYFKLTLAPGPADYTTQIGPAGAGWKPLVGDWDGDGIDTPGLYSGEAFFLSNDFGWGRTEIIVGFGPGGADWQPLAGDWDGDGHTTIGLYSDAGVFFLKNDLAPGEADWHYVFGAANPEHIALTGDWDGDGIDTVGVYARREMQVHTLPLVESEEPGDSNVPLAGVFFLRNEHSPGFADVTFDYGPGSADWVPLVGPWTSPLTQAKLDNVVDVALERLEHLGLDVASLEELAALRFVIGGVPAPLHTALDKTAYFHPLAGGEGWFIDASPLDDEEFTATGAGEPLSARSGTEAVVRVDALTAVMKVMRRQVARQNGSLNGPYDRYAIGLRDIPTADTLDEWFATVAV